MEVENPAQQPAISIPLHAKPCADAKIMALTTPGAANVALKLAETCRAKEKLRS